MSTAHTQMNIQEAAQASSLLRATDLPNHVCRRLSFPWRSILSKAHLPMVLTVLAVGLFGHFFGERIKENGGLGYDGVKYGVWAKNFYHEILVVGVNDYDTQRILPSAIVHYCLRLFGISLTDSHVIHAFGVLNALLLGLSAFVWSLLADMLEISPPGKWLGFVALFISFAILKWACYNPVLTDVSGFTTGMLMVYFYVRRSQAWLYVVTLLSSFIWPASFYVGGLMLLFPKKAERPVEAGRVRYRLNLVIGSVIGIVLVAYIRHLLHNGYMFRHGGVAPVRDIMKLSLATVLCYVVFGLGALLKWDQVLSPVLLCRAVQWEALFPVAGALAGIKGVQYWLANDTSGFGVRDLLSVAAYTSVTRPGIFYVAHVVFYGPILILALFLWRPVCRLIHEQGMGMTLCAAVGLLLSLFSESRCLFNFYPIFVPFIVKATDLLSWRPAHYWLLAVLSVLMSKVWLTINSVPLSGNVLEIPDQYYFMSHGPFMSNQMYLVQGAAVVLCGLLMYVVCFRNVPTGKLA